VKTPMIDFDGIETLIASTDTQALAGLRDRAVPSANSGPTWHGCGDSRQFALARRSLLRRDDVRPVPRKAWPRCRWLGRSGRRHPASKSGSGDVRAKGDYRGAEAADPAARDRTTHRAKRVYT
jgi:hypothetical protein